MIFENFQLESFELNVLSGKLSGCILSQLHVSIDNVRLFNAGFFLLFPPLEGFSENYVLRIFEYGQHLFHRHTFRDILHPHECIGPSLWKHHPEKTDYVQLCRHNFISF